MNWHDFVQLWVLITSAAAIQLTARTDHWQRWGFVLGLISEPAWIMAAWEAQQWGVGVLAAWWSWFWAVGAWRRFKKPIPSSIFLSVKDWNDAFNSCHRR